MAECETTGLLHTLLEGFAAPPSDDIFYLSFATEDAFLGGCYVPAASHEQALAWASLNRCNPGGEVEIFGPFPPEMIKPSHIGRLITDKDEIDGAEAQP